MTKQAKNETSILIETDVPIPTSLESEAKTSAAPATANAVDLEAPGMAKIVAKRILADIDAWCSDNYDDGPRTHLGASLIGHECRRYLFYVFRWCAHKKHDGRQQRLFNRGHREEARFIEWLEGIGAKVWAMDEKGDQFRISECGGHFGGSLDGICQLPPQYGIPDPILLEFKTNGTGAGFNKLVSDGMPIAKPQHYAQTSTYGSRPYYGFKWCLYMNINKNDDSMHVELVKLDWNLGEQMVNKANTIILAKAPPERLSNDPRKRECTYCDFVDICHKGKPVDMNCRSCVHAEARNDKEWFCKVHNGAIPKEFIPVGCPQYASINVNV